MQYRVKYSFLSNSVIYKFVQLKSCCLSKEKLLVCRVDKNLPVLELLNNFIKSSTVAYKRVAYKKNIVYLYYNFLTIFFNYRKTWFPVPGINIQSNDKQTCHHYATKKHVKRLMSYFNQYTPKMFVCLTNLVLKKWTTDRLECCSFRNKVY